MKILAILSLLILVSCGAKKVVPNYGKTTLSELKAMKGEPSKEEVIPVKNSKILHYANGDKYQVTNDVVSNAFLNADEKESTLIYWKHAFKDCDIKIEELSKDRKNHEKIDLLMKCDQLGTGVVYNEDSSNILRVIKYEAK